ncbi:Galectin [Aphelenchoides besseyi]|nr:Galectin [Aphelenchoides besseyi]
MLDGFFVSLFLLIHSSIVTSELQNEFKGSGSQSRNNDQGVPNNQPLTVQVDRELVLKCVTTNVDQWIIALSTETINSTDLTQQTIPFYLAFLFDNKTLVVNSKLPGSWDQANSSTNEGNFWHKQRDIDIRLWFRDTYLFLFVNTMRLATFNYRQPITRINNLYHNEGFIMKSSELTGKPISMPFAESIPFGSFRPGSKLLVSFYINWDTGADSKDAAIRLVCKDNNTIAIEIAFHVLGLNQVTRNSFINNVWGQEEDSGGQPIYIDYATLNEVLIDCQEDQFVIMLNGEAFCTYKHRIAPENIVQLASRPDYDSVWANVQYFAPDD